MMFSNMVLCGNRLKRWNTMPISARNASTSVRGSCTEMSLTHISPLDASSSAFRQRRKVICPSPMAR